MRYRIFNGQRDGTFTRDHTIIDAPYFASVFEQMRQRGWEMEPGQLFIVVEDNYDAQDAGREPMARIFKYVVPDAVPYFEDVVSE